MNTGHLTSLSDRELAQAMIMAGKLEDHYQIRNGRFKRIEGENFIYDLEYFSEESGEWTRGELEVQGGPGGITLIEFR